MLSYGAVRVSVGSPFIASFESGVSLEYKLAWIMEQKTLFWPKKFLVRHVQLLILLMFKSGDQTKLVRANFKQK
jgi:NAD(P)H-dependent flavin oxidoreductase YrpB (nitropropane dioxygenase family)